MRCDFCSRPPRIDPARLDRLFRDDRDSLLVVDLESLIRMKQTQRAKDHAVIGELATRFPPELEVELTTDPDRLLTLAPAHGASSDGHAVRAALTKDREAVVIALALEQDAQQRADRARVQAYAAAAERYVAAFVRMPAEGRRLPGGHREAVALAERVLPLTLDPREDRGCRH